MRQCPNMSELTIGNLAIDSLTLMLYVSSSPLRHVTNSLQGW